LPNPSVVEDTKVQQDFSAKSFHLNIRRTK
jgi:hypothetical protein